jgi:hypothetical protein
MIAWSVQSMTPLPYPLLSQKGVFSFRPSPPPFLTLIPTGRLNLWKEGTSTVGKPHLTPTVAPVAPPLVTSGSTPLPPPGGEDLSLVEKWMLTNYTTIEEEDWSETWESPPTTGVMIPPPGSWDYECDELISLAYLRQGLGDLVPFIALCDLDSAVSSWTDFVTRRPYALAPDLVDCIRVTKF